VFSNYQELNKKVFQGPRGPVPAWFVLRGNAATAGLHNAEHPCILNFPV
jgi:hypothetical protein